MSRDNKEPIAAASGARTGRGGRFSAPRKAQAVPGLLRGEDLELLSRELGVAASTLSLWREEFLAAGQKGQVCRPRNAVGDQLVFKTRQGETIVLIPK